MSYLGTPFFIILIPSLPHNKEIHRTEHMYHLTVSFGLMAGSHFASQGNQNIEVPVPLSVRHINLLKQFVL